MDKYEYNPDNVIISNPNTGIVTFKGRLKTDPNEIVFIKKIPNARALSGLGDMIFSSYEKYKPGKYLYYFLLTFIKFIVERFLKNQNRRTNLTISHLLYAGP